MIGGKIVRGRHRRPDCCPRPPGERLRAVSIGSGQSVRRSPSCTPIAELNAAPAAAQGTAGRACLHSDRFRGDRRGPFFCAGLVDCELVKADNWPLRIGGFSIEAERIHPCAQRIQRELVECLDVSGRHRQGFFFARELTIGPGSRLFRSGPPPVTEHKAARDSINGRASPPPSCRPVRAAADTEDHTKLYATTMPRKPLTLDT